MQSYTRGTEGKHEWKGSWNPCKSQPLLHWPPVTRIPLCAKKRQKREREREISGNREGYVPSRHPPYISVGAIRSILDAKHIPLSAFQSLPWFTNTGADDSHRAMGNCEHSPAYSANTSFHKFHLRIHVTPASRLLLINTRRYCIRIACKSVEQGISFWTKKIYIVP